MKFYIYVVFGLLVTLQSSFGVTAVKRTMPGFQGIVEAYRYADISPEISGRIVKIGIPEGKSARVGDTIVKIEYTEDYLQAERSRIIAKNEAELKSAKLKVETAKLEYDATKLVFDSTGAVSEEELWGKKYQFEAASAEYDQLVVQKQREQIEYKIAQARLKTHFIIAPYACTVAKIKMREWEHCRDGEPLVSVVDASKCRFVTYVPISITRKLSVGKSVPMQIDTKNGFVVRTGTVTFISPVVDPSSDLLTVKIVFNNSDGSIKPGVSGYLKVSE